MQCQYITIQKLYLHSVQIITDNISSGALLTDEHIYVSHTQYMQNAETAHVQIVTQCLIAKEHQNKFKH